MEQTSSSRELFRPRVFPRFPGLLDDLTLLIMSGGHGGEAIPVPIPNTEVKLSCADDSAFAARK